MTQATHRQNGAAIRRSRCERGIKPGELARRVEIDRRSLTAIESGRAQASWELLYRLKSALDVPLNELLSDAGRDERRERERIPA